MDMILLVGLALVLTALPGMALGLVLLVGLWRPAALEGAADPDALRRKVASRVLAIAGIVAASGLGLVLMRS